MDNKNIENDTRERSNDEKANNKLIWEQHWEIRNCLKDKTTSDKDTNLN